MTEQYYESEARAAILAGAETLYSAVKTTMGPKGRNVIIGSRHGNPVPTHDGVTVAKAVQVRDEKENVGAQIIKQAAMKLNDTAGDGTTTVSVLTYHLLKAANEYLDSHEDANPMVLAREIEAAAEGVLKYLEKNKTEADNLETLKRIATISAADEEIGTVVAEVIDELGANATVTVQPSTSLETTKEIINGFELDTGYATHHLVTDTTKMEAVIEDAAVILVDGKIQSFAHILPLLEKVAEQQIKQLVVVAESFEGDTLPTFVLNNVQGVFRTLAVLAPSFGSRREEIMGDLAVATSAQVIDGKSVTLADAMLEHVGKVEKVISTNNKTTFIKGAGDTSLLESRLTAEIAAESDPNQLAQLQKRLGLLTGKVAAIHVGGQTDSEVREKIFRVDDAVAATKAAKAEGILPGGGITLFLAPVGSKTEGAKVLAAALKQPFYQLIANSGMDVVDALNMVNMANSKSKETMGYNVKTGKLVNLLEEGIIDPYIVTRQALATAVSLAVIGITTGALIVEEEETSEDD